MVNLRMPGLLAIALAMTASGALAYESSHIVGRWDCDISNRAEKLNARIYFTVEENGEASSIGTVQIAGDEGLLKFQFKGRMMVRVQGNALFEAPVSSKVLSASFDGQELDEAFRKNTEASLMTPYDTSAQILSLSSQNLIYKREGTITDCSRRE